MCWNNLFVKGLILLQPLSDGEEREKDKVWSQVLNVEIKAPGITILPDASVSLVCVRGRERACTWVCCLAYSEGYIFQSEVNRGI